MKHLVSWSTIALMVLCLAPGIYAQMLQGDDFDGTELKDIWTIQNGDLSPWNLQDGWLVIEAGFNQNLWGSDDTTRFYQLTDQDFDVETSVIVDYRDASTVAGIAAISPTTQDSQGRDGEWVTLKLWGRGGNDNNAVLQYQRRENDSADLGYVGTQPNYMPDQGAIPLEMRIKRTGDVYQSWFKPEAEGDWVEVGEVTSELGDPLEVGLFAGIADGPGAGVMTVSYDYFKVDGTTAVDPANRLATTWSVLKSQ